MLGLCIAGDWTHSPSLMHARQTPSTDPISSPGTCFLSAFCCAISAARGRNPSSPSLMRVPGTATPAVREELPVCAACKLSLIQQVLSAREADKRRYYDHPSPTEKKLRQLWGGGCRGGIDGAWLPLPALRTQPWGEEVELWRCCQRCGRHPLCHSPFLFKPLNRIHSDSIRMFWISGRERGLKEVSSITQGY